MKTFRVVVNLVLQGIFNKEVIVEAEDEDEAEYLASEKVIAEVYDNDLFLNFDVGHDEIIECEEI